MNLAYKYLVLIFFVILTTSCKEVYWPDLGTNYDDLIVVDGYIANKKSPYSIKLSHPSMVYFDNGKPVTDCAVSVIDNLGNSEKLEEIKPGNYTTSDDFEGVVGRSYQLQIITPQGEEYRSTYEKLNEPTGIRSVYAEIETRKDPELWHDLIGYQFYIDTELASHNTNYYLWRLDATYQYNVDFKVWYIFDHWTLSDFPKHDSLFTCWQTYKVGEIFTMSTTELSEPVIDRYPFHFVSTETRMLSVRYSLLVKQLSLSETAYVFWTEHAQINANNDILNSQQPYQVRGNISNINNPNELVLGYFFAAGLSEKRIFIDKPPAVVPFYYSKCELTRRDYEAYGDIWMSGPSNWPIYLTQDPDGARAYPSQGCLDCRRKGGTVEKPDFWMD